MKDSEADLALKRPLYFPLKTAILIKGWRKSPFRVNQWLQSTAENKHSQPADLGSARLTMK